MFCKVALCLVVLGVASIAVANDIPLLCRQQPSAATCAAFDAAGDGLQPHPADCRLFYYCVDTAHAPICRQCPAGLHFNPTLHVCDLPENAGCQ